MYCPMKANTGERFQQAPEKINECFIIVVFNFFVTLNLYKKVNFAWALF